MTESKAHSWFSLVLTSALVAGLFALPARAQTEEKLEEAKARYERVLEEANAATARYEQANSEYIRTQDLIAETEAGMAAARDRKGRFDQRLGKRAREAYEQGPSSTLSLLLSSRSFTEFSDRMVFLDHLAQGDSDLVVRVSVLSEELRRRREDLAALQERNSRALREATAARDVMYDKLGEAQDLLDDLKARFAAEQRLAQIASQAGAVIVQGQALEACPVPGSTFVDSYGAPRSGGRSHQGVDMMAPYGTPVYSAQAGVVQHSSSSLGGISAYVYGDGGDTTFYAHLQGYTEVSAGTHVAAGVHIGYVGDTGNASGTPHLHFEYHPGGGGAVNPTPYVRAVCG